MKGRVRDWQNSQFASKIEAPAAVLNGNVTNNECSTDRSSTRGAWPNYFDFAMKEVG
jgi:hypothetical protein